MSACGECPEGECDGCGICEYLTRLNDRLSTEEPE